MPDFELNLWKRLIPVSFDAEKGTAQIDEKTYKVETTQMGQKLNVEVDGKAYQIEVVKGRVYVNGEEQRCTITKGKPRVLGKGKGGAAAKGARVKPPMPGRIVSLDIKVGDAVKKGQGLLVLEAMKMQNEVTAPAEGVVKAIHVKPGQTVDGNFVMI